MESTKAVKNESVDTYKFSFSLEHTLFWIFSGLVFLLPIIFIPTPTIPLLFVKYGLLVVAVVAAVAVWILMRLKDGVCLLPVDMLSLSGVFVLFVMLLSSLFSGSILNSLIGQLPQTDTFIFYIYVFVLFFMAPSVFTSAKRIFDLYRILLVSVAILAVFHLSRLVFGSNFLSFGYFLDSASNMLGKWNDLGIYFGLGAVISLVTIELQVLSRRMKIMLYSILGACLVLLSVINFSSIWYVLGVLSLIFFVYSIVIARSGATKKTAQLSLPVASFVVFLISVAFVIGGSVIGGLITSNLNISQVEVTPTWQATSGIAKNVLTEGSILKTILGAGPNRFVNQWLLYKPVAVNSSIFWNTDFIAGAGLLPSTLVTTGILGFLAWLAFIGIFVYMGFRSILSRIADSFQRYIVTSTFLAALYLWLFNVIYVPSLVIIVLTFLFTGLFLASLYNSGILKAVRFEYFKNPKVGFVSVLSLIVILILGLGLVYSTISKFVAVAYYNNGIVEVNKNNLDVGEQKIKSAITFDKNDLYARSLAQLYLVRLSNLLSNAASSTSEDLLKSQFSNISNTALSAAQFAVQIDQSDYQNWLIMGDVWGALVPLKIEKSYDNALAAYQSAYKLNPQNPYTYLQMAKLETARNNAEQAKSDLNKALALKRDYTDAYMFLAQLQSAEGDTKSAIESVSAAVASSPNNPGLFFQLGLLRYDSKDYRNAVSSFEQAVILSNQYANAKYFLGLSYYKIDRVNDAIAQFTDLQKLSPDSKEVTTILNNLKAGLAPLSKLDAAATVGTTTKKTDK